MRFSARRMAWPCRPRGARAAVVGTLLLAAVGGASGSTAGAGAVPTDSTTVTFEVMGGPHGGDLHIAVAGPGGLEIPATAGATVDVPLTRAGVIDARGGGTRDWSATVEAIEFTPGTAVRYRVGSPTGTGTVSNHVPDWTLVDRPAQAVSVNGISQPYATWSWSPGLRVTTPAAGVGSSGDGPTGSRGALITSVA